MTNINTLSATNAYRNQLKMQESIKDALGGGGVRPQKADHEHVEHDGLEPQISFRPTDKERDENRDGTVVGAE